MNGFKEQTKRQMGTSRVQECTMEKQLGTTIDPKEQSERGSFLVACALLLFAFGCQSDEGSKVHPQKVHSEEKPDQHFRKEKPGPQSIAPITFPTFERESLENGLEVWVSENHHLPITDVAFVTRVGTIQEKNGQGGLAALTFGALSEGTKELDAYALHDAFQRLGTRLAVSVGREGGRLSLNLLKRNLADGLKLMRDVVTHPLFSSDGFDRVKKKRLTYVKARRANPSARAADAFLAVTYGEEHGYGKPPYGTTESLSSLTVADAKTFWKTHVAPGNSALIFTGDITMQEAKDLAQRHFGQWANSADPVDAPKMPPQPEAFVHLLPAPPNAPQTVMFFGRPLTSWSDGDDIYVASVMNQILGGMFSSRLNLNLREEKGWTYGAQSDVSTRLGPGPFYAMSSIQSEHGPAAVAEFLREFKRMREEPVTVVELQNAKDNATKSLPSKFETVTALSNAAEELFMNRLPLDFFQQIPEKINAVTVDEVNQMARRALREEGLTIVLLGDVDQTAPGLEALELSRPIKIWDDDTSKKQ